MPAPNFERPTGIPETYEAHVRVMFDLMALAFQTDSTRMITFTLANDGSNRAFPDIGVPEAHHQLSHHRGNPATLDKIARIDRYYVEQFAWFLERLYQRRQSAPAQQSAAAACRPRRRNAAAWHAAGGGRPHADV